MQRNSDSLLWSHIKISFCCDVEQALPRVLKSGFDLQIPAFCPDWHLTVKVININEPICIPFENIFALWVHAFALLLRLFIDEANALLATDTCAHLFRWWHWCEIWLAASHEYSHCHNSDDLSAEVLRSVPSVGLYVMCWVLFFSSVFAIISRWWYVKLVLKQLRILSTVSNSISRLGVLYLNTCFYTLSFLKQVSICNYLWPTYSVLIFFM